MTYGGSIFGVVGAFSSRQWKIHAAALIAISAVCLCFFAPPTTAPTRILALPPSPYYYGEYYGDIAGKWRQPTYEMCKERKAADDKKTTDDEPAKNWIYDVLVVLALRCLFRWTPYLKILDVLTQGLILACNKIKLWVIKLRTKAGLEN
ncbi:hypothetical protein BSKO_04235 [Bryopsis sp. KO-2023]|nr:hypothetical protein BSKO_04235 [Bryopsis sp. KO-2023]